MIVVHRTKVPRQSQCRSVPNDEKDIHVSRQTAAERQCQHRMGLFKTKNNIIIKTVWGTFINDVMQQGGEGLCNPSFRLRMRNCKCHIKTVSRSSKVLTHSDRKGEIKMKLFSFLFQTSDVVHCQSLYRRKRQANAINFCMGFWRVCNV